MFKYIAVVIAVISLALPAYTTYLNGWNFESVFFGIIAIPVTAVGCLIVLTPFAVIFHYAKKIYNEKR